MFIALVLPLLVCKLCFGSDLSGASKTRTHRYAFSFELPLHPSTGDLPTPMDDGAPVFPEGEESEDEDDSKEKFFSSQKCLHIENHLQEILARQNAIFHATHRDVLTPPPRF